MLHSANIRRRFQANVTREKAGSMSKGYSSPRRETIPFPVYEVLGTGHSLVGRQQKRTSVRLGLDWARHSSQEQTEVSRERES